MRTSSAESSGCTGNVAINVGCAACDVGRVTCALPHPLCSERRHLYNVVQKMSGSLRCILRLRHIDSTSPLPSPRRRPVADSRHIIYVPSGDWCKLYAKAVAELPCAGSFNQVVLQPTSMNLPAKKYEFNAVFDAEATHDAVFAQVGGCRVRLTLLLARCAAVDGNVYHDHRSRRHQCRHHDRVFRAAGDAFDSIVHGRVYVAAARLRRAGFRSAAPSTPAVCHCTLVSCVAGKSNTLFGSQGNPGVLRRSLREMFRQGPHMLAPAAITRNAGLPCSARRRESPLTRST